MDIRAEVIDIARDEPVVLWITWVRRCPDDLDDHGAPYLLSVVPDALTGLRPLVFGLTAEQFAEHGQRLAEAARSGRAYVVDWSNGGDRRRPLYPDARALGSLLRAVRDNRFAPSEWDGIRYS